MFYITRHYFHRYQNVKLKLLYGRQVCNGCTGWEWSFIRSRQQMRCYSYQSWFETLCQLELWKSTLKTKRKTLLNDRKVVYCAYPGENYTQKKQNSRFNNFICWKYVIRTVISTGMNGRNKHSTPAYAFLFRILGIFQETVFAPTFSLCFVLCMR